MPVLCRSVQLLTNTKSRLSHQSDNNWLCSRSLVLDLAVSRSSPTRRAKPSAIMPRRIRARTRPSRPRPSRTPGTAIIIPCIVPKPSSTTIIRPITRILRIPPPIPSQIRRSRASGKSTPEPRPPTLRPRTIRLRPRVRRRRFVPPTTTTSASRSEPASSTAAAPAPRPPCGLTRCRPSSRTGAVDYPAHYADKEQPKQIPRPVPLPAPTPAPC